MQNRMIRYVSSYLVVGLVTFCVVGVAVSTALGEPPQAKTVRRPSGVRAYVDPKTGKLAVPPVDERQAIGGAAAEPAEGIMEMPSGGSAGGFMINTQGRFTADVMATTDSSGKTTLECAPGPGARVQHPSGRPTK